MQLANKLWSTTRLSEVSRSSSLVYRVGLGEGRSGGRMSNNPVWERREMGGGPHIIRVLLP